jgi:hypothetical protein
MYDHAFAGIGQFIDHVAADIASAASYEDRHGFTQDLVLDRYR